MAASISRRLPLHPTATIVLPVHNMERTLRPEVMRILDLAEVLSRRVQVAIVDDGSHDGTYETACELAREFPQVRALRQPYQRGLGGALEQVRAQLRVDQVVAHNGVAAIDLEDLADVLTAPVRGRSEAVAPTRQPATEACGSRRFAAPMTLNPGHQGKSRGTSSFRWLRLDEPTMPRRSRAAHQVASAAAGILSAPVEGATTFTATAFFAS
jgi:hypothetical protein